MSLDAPTPEPEWRMHWGRRLQEYLNATRRQVDTAIAAANALITANGASNSWDPSVSGLTFSAETGRYQKSGNWVTAVYRGTISGVDGAGNFITFTLPETMSGAVNGDILAWGEAVYQDVSTVYVGKPIADSSTVVSIRPQQADGLGSGAWRSDGAQPVATFSSGDILSFVITYPTA